MFRELRSDGTYGSARALVGADGGIGGANQNLSIFASAVRAASVNSADQKNYRGRGVQVVIDMTAVPTVETVTFTIEGKDEISGKYYTILASTAIVAVSTVILRVYPGIVVAANLSANDALPADWRVKATHSASGNFTYSVGANLLL